jgi:hypothetical protein
MTITRRQLLILLPAAARRHTRSFSQLQPVGPLVGDAHRHP